MGYKIAFIGGGSVLWASRLGADLLLEPSLRGSELVLVDIAPDAAELMVRYLGKMNERLGCAWKIRASGMEEALDSADVVTVSISTGGFEAMALDYTIPEKYGVFHSVADTVGPGGISRSLRNIPVFLGIAEKMSRLCPDAVMLHVTNPLSQLTRAVAKSGLVKCCGLCHEYIAILNFMKDFFRLGSLRDVDAVCTGVNHFTLLTGLVCKGIKDPMSELSMENYIRFQRERTQAGHSGTVDDEVEKAVMQPQSLPYYFNFYLYELFGKTAFPAAGTPHFCENFPFFNSSPEILKKLNIGRKGVLPNRPARKKERRDEILRRLETGGELPEIAKRSNETLADAMVGLCTGEPRRIIASVPNGGQIENLPREAVVETWATAARKGILPENSGSVPPAYAGYVRQVVAEQEMTVEAAMTGDRRKVVQAMVLSPMLTDKLRAEELADELLAAHRKFLPQFK